MQPYLLGRPACSPLQCNVVYWSEKVSHCLLCVQTEAFGTDMTPIARPAQPKEYGPPAVFLATESDSSYVVGAILSVTGGMLIN